MHLIIPAALVDCSVLYGLVLLMTFKGNGSPQLAGARKETSFFAKEMAIDTIRI